MESKSAALFITNENQRKTLLEHARCNDLKVTQVYEGTTPKKAEGAWQQLVTAAHGTSFTTVLIDSIADVPGGLFTRLREIRRLSNTGVRMESLQEPWLDLERQAALISFILDSHRAQTRDRIVAAIRNSKGRVGRPPLTIDVAALVEARTRLSVRAAAKQFGIGAASVSRLEAAWRQAHPASNHSTSGDR